MAGLVRVVITGIGMVTPLGHSLARTMAALDQGESGLAPVTSFDATGFRRDRAGGVKDFNARDYFRVPKAMKLTDRTSKWAVAAAVMALEDAGLERAGSRHGAPGRPDRRRAPDLQAAELSRAIGPDPARRCVQEIPFFAERVLSGLNPLWLLINLPNMTSAHVAIQNRGARPEQHDHDGLGLRASRPWARRRLDPAAGRPRPCSRRRRSRRFDPLAFAATSGRDSCDARDPQDAGGFNPGEGAAVLCWKNANDAVRRGARLSGEVCGYAASASLPPAGRKGPPSCGAGADDARCHRETGWTPAESRRS